jgi:hypothetical protein
MEPRGFSTISIDVNNKKHGNNNVGFVNILGKTTYPADCRRQCISRSYDRDSQESATTDNFVAR